MWAEQIFIVVYRLRGSRKARKSLKSAMNNPHALLASVQALTYMSDRCIPLGRMDHVALPTNDAARGERFYCDVLGFHAVPRPSFSFDGRWLVHDAVGVMLHLIHAQDYERPSGPLNTMRGHFALRCPDIEIALHTFRAHKIEFVERRLPDYGYRQVFIQDPDGNIIELGEWPESSIREED
jgi:catechol 2,3-dioxygenase-like lactoylglutathione lyase family enzyme